MTALETLAAEMGSALGKLERDLLSLMVQQEHRIVALEARLEILEGIQARAAASVGALKIVAGRDVPSDDPAAA